MTPERTGEGSTDKVRLWRRSSWGLFLPLQTTTCGGMLCARFDTVDSVAATLLSVKTTSNLRGMVRVEVDTFDIEGAAST